MYGFKKLFGSFALVALLSAGSIGVAGCANERQAIADVATSATTTTPAQAKTVAEATQLAAITERLLSVYVKSGAATRPVLDQLEILVPPVHNTLKKAQAAQAAGDSPLVAASLTGFNEALLALNKYKQAKGIQ